MRCLPCIRLERRRWHRLNSCMVAAAGMIVHTASPSSNSLSHATAGVQPSSPTAPIWPIVCIIGWPRDSPWFLWFVGKLQHHRHMAEKHESLSQRAPAQAMTSLQAELTEWTPRHPVSTTSSGCVAMTVQRENNLDLREEKAR